MPKTPPKDFGPSKRLQREYEAGIKRIARYVLKPKMPEQTLDQWLADIAARSRAADVQEASDWLSRRMVHWVNVKNAKTWREAASRNQQSRKLYGLLAKEMQGATGAAVSRLVRENAALISSVPLVAAQKLTEEVKNAQQSGARAGTINKMMRSRFPELLRSRTNLISRTETAKASAALTEARAEELNLPCYIWESSKDVRTRESHLNMHGVVVFYAQAPDPEQLIGLPSNPGHYHAGNDYNCRCTQIVVLSLDDIVFPARVCWQGAIRIMTKQQFKQIALGLQSRQETAA